MGKYNQEDPSNFGYLPWVTNQGGKLTSSQRIHPLDVNAANATNLDTIEGSLGSNLIRGFSNNK
jgi:hypothetical protein